MKILPNYSMFNREEDSQAGIHGACAAEQSLLEVSGGDW